jgi:hypothetical protein
MIFTRTRQHRWLSLRNGARRLNNDTYLQSAPPGRRHKVGHLRHRASKCDINEIVIRAYREFPTILHVCVPLSPPTPVHAAAPQRTEGRGDTR